MTPKEKADQLVTEYACLLITNRDTAIIAAARCVNEILPLTTWCDKDTQGAKPEDTKEFWEQVKEKIVKL